MQYKDAAGWRAERLTGDRLREHQDFWQGELAGASVIVPLPTDHPRPPVASLAGERVLLSVPDQLTEQVAVLAGRLGVTEFVVARCAVSLLLLAETGLTDITLGSYTRGRGRQALEDGVGFFAHTVPLRLRVLPDDDVRSLLTRAQHDGLRALRHEEYPYGWTMRDLGWRRGPERAPLFDVLVALNEAAPTAEPARLLPAFEPRQLPVRAKEADLQFAFWRSPGRLRLSLTYATELFSAERAERLLARLLDVLRALVADRPIVELLKQPGAGS
ncbi:hypothetical protein GCM10009665_43000 [Kitasatospora nipponensis]|uniref:Condensation domain-containing protein n=1 Tax=Kitasatospora nipponensis TaxID=258049 RepID=A0ABN1WGG5_9ACTN